MFKFAPYSYSKIGVYKGCPYKFKLQNIDKIRTKFNQTPQLEKGSFLHYGIELYLKKDKEAKEKLNNYEFKESNKEQIKEYISQLKRIIKGENIQFYKTFDNLEIEEGFGLYYDNEFKLGKYSNKALIRGYIDLMYYDDFQNKVYIIDHKSGKYNPNQNELQLFIYYLVGVLKYPNANEYILKFDFIEQNKDISFRYTKNDFEKISRKVIEAILEIENESNFIKKDNWCNYCPYYKEGHCEGFIDTSIQEMKFT